MVVEDEGALVAQQRMFGAEVLRLSLTEVYQNLNAQSILQEMVEGKLIQPQNKGAAEAYSSKYAQNISAGVALFNMRSPATFLFVLCSILESRDSPKQRKLAMTLRSGIYVPNMHTYCTLLGGCYVYSSTINQLPTQEGVKVRISTVVRANIKGMV